MQVLTGTRRENTLLEWNELLAKAEKRLAESEECYRRFGDEDSAAWVQEDRAKVEEIRQKRAEVVKCMDALGIK